MDGSEWWHPDSRVGPTVGGIRGRIRKVDWQAWAILDGYETSHVLAGSVACGNQSGGETEADSSTHWGEAMTVISGTSSPKGRKRQEIVIGLSRFSDEDPASCWPSQRSTPRTVAVYSTASLNEAQSGSTQSEESLYEPASFEASREKRGGSQSDNRRQ